MNLQSTYGSLAASNRLLEIGLLSHEFAWKALAATPESISSGSILMGEAPQNWQVPQRPRQKVLI